jgi:hypothetical protein avisC_05358
MAERTFVVNAPLDQAREVVLNVFTSEGWTVSPFSGDTVQISRGKKGMSVVFGALMGDDFYLSQNLQFGTGPRGETLVRYLSWTASAFIGGAIGMHKSLKTHEEYVAKLAQVLQSQGLLLGMQ